MTVKCDHGIRLDRWCADCEDGFAYVTEITTTYAKRRRELRRQSGLLAAGALLAIALGAVYVAVR